MVAGMFTGKRAGRFVGVTLAISSLLSCYGTKVPPPEPSPSGPPALGVMPDASDLVIPNTLPELLVVYRQWLYDLNRHLSPEMAAAYANAEVERISTQYAGREAALKDAIQTRLRAAVPPPQTRLKELPTSAYPTDAEFDGAENAG